MTRMAALSLALLCIASNALGQHKRHWVPVRGHKGVYVDLESIQHFPSRHVGGASNIVPTPDTTVDIKVGRHIVVANSFWCKERIVFGDPGYEGYKDLKTGKTVAKKITEPSIPMEAIYPVICPK